ncbi:hypothetical protein Kpol_2001p1 [Vanderwaltozyma polyspora DSM 70294]|uniref:U3 small nucleolar RNA-associated protein 10 n=1 Tax=Vanderwaltozyma polyspora (strain ATCC 22028 / DSM 70294 / BCRC 21397 / CBS 2163 / NBRC 10782 / NRRL Y-8283 / UCD 57-17) TaxID=436907 RepID=A7TGN8_VANPO|nr:uncharacterized protein Kpol_2001p1 [Vanderwaltozyma polyspora DSM 70294]EDO18501.1 hypothetical protein Kpol_2001p1 [Vanderwaltozyma polyspora DSM 70294]
MSSLKDQLAQVAQSNSTVALDRKRRQKLHSASLIYNTKTAATQDYDFIYESALKALDELIEIEPKFKVFQKTLFSETSMAIDRNVQTKDEIKDLDNAIFGFLMLASSKWQLTPTLYATEWLVRRFQIHILNSEILLLSTLNFYQSPIFKRILDIVKLPPLFNPLSTFVRSDKNPSNMTIVKLFNDNDFIKLYTNYLSKCIKHHMTYTNQLLFTTCCFINLIAFNSNNEEKLNQLIPILLEVSAKLLASNSTDCQIAAHTTLVVLATSIQLNKNIILAAVETILSGLENADATKSALVAICKLFQTMKGTGNVDHLPMKLYKLFNNKYSLDNLIELLSTSDSPKADKFITCYLRAITRFDHPKLTSVVKLLKAVTLEKFEVRLIITDLIHLSEIMEDKSNLIDVFTYFISINEDLVISCLKSLNLTPDLFEIRLTTSLFKSNILNENTDATQLESEKIMGKNNKSVTFKAFLAKNSQFINTSAKSMLVESDEKYCKLLSLFVESVGKGYPSGQFLTSFITTVEARMTFLLRIIVSPAAPTTLRLIALTNISKYMSNIDKDSNVFTFVPCLLCALNDVSKNVRSNVKKILSQISKRPFTKHYFLQNEIYGENNEIPMLSPKDGEAWLNKFLSDYVDDNYDISHLIIPKKNDTMYLVFWANQALFMPLPYPKMVLLNYLNKQGKASAFSNIFEPFMKTYLENRKTWVERCIANKTDIDQFESSIADVISSKEKHQFMIDFIINVLNSEHESLANIIIARLIKVFTSLKFNHQLKIVETIVEATISPEANYDAVAILQSLPLSTEIFISILKENKINSDSEIADFTKRRRRRSSTNKNALQKEEVSLLAELHLRKITSILETLDKAKVTGSDVLLSHLFSILSDLETLGEDGGLPVLYAEETLASCMLNTIQSLKDNGISKLSNVRADVLISVIRSSQSPQVQNKLLLVVGSLATLSPETTLHSVMPIFTFMGAHIIRQDNEFTASVVEKTILTIVPALLESNPANLRDEIEFLLITFTTALQHVPKHRRVKLYSTLVQALGPNIAIAPFLFLVSQQYSNNVATFKLGEAKAFVEFTKSFMANFDAIDQLNGINEFFKLIHSLMVESNVTERNAKFESRALFTNGILNFTDSEMLLFFKNAINFVNNVIKENYMDYYDINASLKVRIYSMLLDVRTDGDIIKSVKSNFASVISSIIILVKEVNLSIGHTSVEANESSSEVETTDYKVDTKSVLLEVLGNFMTILPIDDFIDSVLPLLESTTNEDVRYHVTLSISKKFESEPLDAVDAATKTINVLLDRVKVEENSVNILQVTLNSVSTLVAKFGDKLDNSLINRILAIGTSYLSSDEKANLVSSITLITNSVQVLGIKAISFYPKIVRPILKIFKEIREDKTLFLRHQLQLSILLLFAALIKRLPSFLNSNLYELFEVIFYSDEVEVTTRLSVISLVVENMDKKEILRTLNKIWNNSVCKSEDSIAISLFLSCLESTTDVIEKKVASTQSPVFFKLLLSLFEYRSISSFDNNTISKIEATVHKIVNTYVLKLNDKVFRPLFVIVINWAFEAEGVVNKNITEVERLTAFFKFFGKLQENLKGIITSYFTYLLEPTNTLLKRFISKDIADVNLQRLVLISLTSSFRYDKDEYWNSTSRFELISESLVDQLTVIENVIGKYLSKAISSLTAKNSKVEEHNKIMLKLLVNHMKSTCDSNEKLWAIRSLKLIYSKVGENWLVLLPQLVPTIAELLEDEDEEVEYEVRTGLVKVVENVLGEPFDRYLS